jgi:hypothetical protein
VSPSSMITLSNRVALSRLIPRSRWGIASVVAFVSALCIVGTALAAGYWNVWQANLPAPDGTRTEFSPSYDQDLWYVRMSWTANTHDMNFVTVTKDGTWHGLDAFAQAQWGTSGFGGGGSTPYDRYVLYEPVPGNYTPPGSPTTVKAGCQNPTGKSTVWTNCANIDTGS